MHTFTSSCRNFIVPFALDLCLLPCSLSTWYALLCAQAVCSRTMLHVYILARILSGQVGSLLPKCLRVKSPYDIMLPQPPLDLHCAVLLPLGRHSRQREPRFTVTFRLRI